MSTQAVLQETLGAHHGDVLFPDGAADGMNGDSGGTAGATTADADDVVAREEDAGVGKPLYAAPEQWEHVGAVGVKADIFSLGVMWVEMHMQFSTGRERIEILSDVRRGKLPGSFVNAWPAAAKIAGKMLCARPADRVDAEQLLLDPMFQQDLAASTACTNIATEELARLRHRVAELTFQNLALRRMLREV